MGPNTSAPGPRQLGFVGLGVMGEPMCANLAQKSALPVIGYDQEPAPVERLKAFNVETADTLPELAKRSDVIFLSLPHAEAVDAVCRGADGLFSHMKSGSVLVDMSTSPLDLTKTLNASCSERGIEFADAPVARTREAAVRGDLSIMVGAPQTLFQRLESLLRCMGSEVTLCGSVGAGQIVKLLNNMVLFQNVCALGEAIAVAERNGLDPETLLGVLAKGSADSFALRNHGMKSMVPETFPERAFSTRYARKDLSYALSMAEAAGLDLQSAKIVLQRFEESERAGWSDAYFPAVLNVIRSD